VQLDLKTPERSHQEFQETLAIRIAGKDCLPPISPRRHAIERTFELNPQRPRHA
jgi:hypothetical protein